MQKVIFFSLVLFFSFSLSAQSYEALQENSELTIKTKWKANQAGKKELYVKFKNTAKSRLNVNLELGLYSAGVLAEKAQIADCLKKCFWHNWFRPVHLVIPEDLSNNDIEGDDFEVKVLELKTEEVDECEETHD
ncbi:MAG: hypothetical protein RIC95_06080 [Vicingaceae bacterium]